MEVEELERHEQVVLVGLVRHLVLIDGGISDAELYELIRLGVRIGREEFEAAMDATEPWHEDRAQSLAQAATITDPHAREKLLHELARIGSSDGLHGEEMSFIDRVRASWQS